MGPLPRQFRYERGKLHVVSQHRSLGTQWVTAQWQGANVRSRGRLSVGGRVPEGCFSDVKHQEKNKSRLFRINGLGGNCSHVIDSLTSYTYPFLPVVVSGHCFRRMFDFFFASTLPLPRALKRLIQLGRPDGRLKASSTLAMRD